MSEKGHCNAHNELGVLFKCFRWPFARYMCADKHVLHRYLIPRALYAAFEAIKVGFLEMLFNTLSAQSATRTDVGVFELSDEGFPVWTSRT